MLLMGNYRPVGPLTQSVSMSNLTIIFTGISV